MSEFEENGAAFEALVADVESLFRKHEQAFRAANGPVEHGDLDIPYLMGFSCMAALAEWFGTFEGACKGCRFRAFKLVVAEICKKTLSDTEEAESEVQRHVH